MTNSVFSGKLPILRFRILTAVNMWKNAFFDHPLASEGWHWLKLALKLVFITMKWLLTCFECICSFLLSVCTYKRLYGLYIGMGMARHAQARKKSDEKIFLHRLKMVQFAKLTCLNRQIPTFWKFSLLQGASSPDLVIFSHKKKSKIENFISSIQNGPIRKVIMFKPPNSNILKIFPFTGCLQPRRLSHFLKKKSSFFIDWKWLNA